MLTGPAVERELDYLFCNSSNRYFTIRSIRSFGSGLSVGISTITLSTKQIYLQSFAAFVLFSGLPLHQFHQNNAVLNKFKPDFCAPVY
jgi:hypothetical protein